MLLLRSKLFTLFFLVISSLSGLAEDSPLGINEHPLPDSGTPYGYLSYLPPNYDAKRGKHPLVIFLHGYGELGDGNSQLMGLAKHGPMKLIKKDPAIFAEASAVVLAPQGLKADNWWKWDKLDAFLEHAFKNYAIDRKRVYLTGLSMGGGATWMFANQHPRTFAALVPICGAAKPGNKVEIGKVPTWAFHSIGDKTVPFANSEAWLKALSGKEDLMEDYPKQGIQTAIFDGREWAWSEGQHAPKDGRHPLAITIYPDQSHNSWSRAYQDPKLWEWLFAQSR